MGQFVTLFFLMIFLTSAAMAQGVRQDDGRSQSFQAPDAFDFEAEEDVEGSALPQAPDKEEFQNDAVIPDEALSPIEAMYGERIIDVPRQFGYEMFAQEAGAPNAAEPMGAVQDDYILGIGDELSVSFSGQRNTREKARVDSQGMLVINDFPPLAAAGLSIAQVRKALEERALGLHNTGIYLTMAAVRQIGVLVVGNVKKPGRRNLTVFNTVLDALILSGGVTKDGSLRQIKLARVGESRIVDLYDVLMQGGNL